MSACRRVVVGTDLSRGSDAAMRLAIAWATQHDADVLVVHAATGLSASDQADLEAALRVQANESSPEAMAHPPEFLVADDTPIQALLAAATRAGDWLCVGCEGASATVLRQLYP